MDSPVDGVSEPVPAFQSGFLDLSSDGSILLVKERVYREVDASRLHRILALLLLSREFEE